MGSGSAQRRRAFVETDAAERASPSGERVLLDLAAEVSGLGVAHITRFADRLR
jgi:hypothetical protein